MLCGRALSTTSDVMNLNATRYTWQADDRATIARSAQRSILDIDGILKTKTLSALVQKRW